MIPISQGKEELVPLTENHYMTVWLIVRFINNNLKIRMMSRKIINLFWLFILNSLNVQKRRNLILFSIFFEPISDVFS